MMKHSRYQLIVLSVLITFLGNPAVAQEGGGGGGESPAESSVSTSSSKKSKAAPEAIESNPVVTVVRAGIDLSTAKDMGIAGVKKIAKAGGSFKNLRHVSKAIGKKEVDHTHVISAVDAGLTGGGDGSNLHFLKAAKKVGDGAIKLDQLTVLKQNIDAKFDFDDIFDKHGFDKVTSAVGGGFTGDYLEHLNIDHLVSAAASNTSLSLDDAQIAKQNIDAGFDFDKQLTHGVSTISNLREKGFSGDHLKHLTVAQLNSAISKGETGTSLTVDKAEVAAGHLASGLSLDKLLEHGIDDVTKAIAAGIDVAELETKDSTELDQVLVHVDSGSSSADAQLKQQLNNIGIPTLSLDGVLALNLTVSNVQTLLNAGYTASEMIEFGTTKLNALLSLNSYGLTKLQAATAYNMGISTQAGADQIKTADTAGYSLAEIQVFTLDRLSKVASLIGFGLSKDQAEVAYSIGITTQTGADQIKTADTAGYSLAEIQVFSLDRLSKVISLIGFGLSKDQVEVAYSIGITTQAGADQIKTAVAAGYTLAEIQSLSLTKLADTVALLDSGLSKDDAVTAVSSGVSSAGAALLSQLHSSTQNTALKDTITNVLADAAYTAPSHQAALTAAASIADMILKDVTVTSSSDLPTSINMASFAGNGYNTELVKLLVKYGAVGTMGSDLATAALNGFSTTKDSSENLLGLLSSTTSDYLSLLSTLTGNNDLGDPDGDDDNFMQSSVLKVSLDKINLIPGSTMTLGSKGTASSIDVSSQLTKSTSTADRKILVIGAAKDMTIAGDVTFTNSNDVEDHALAIGAADDLYLRSEYSQANNADYDNPAPINVKYTGSNLGLGSEDTMRLVNVNIETGGNLAISSLNELHIGLSDSHSSTFSVGTGGKNSDPDNVYLVANNLIQVNGLNFSGRLDDVYMEAITINLKDVAFPSTADVMLRSRDGTLHFNTFNNRVVGGVNLTDVSHGGINLSPAHFDNGPAGHIDSVIALPNGTSAIKIRKQ